MNADETNDLNAEVLIFPRTALQGTITARALIRTHPPYASIHKSSYIKRSENIFRKSSSRVSRQKSAHYFENSALLLTVKSTAKRSTLVNY